MYECRSQTRRFVATGPAKPRETRPCAGVHTPAGQTDDRNASGARRRTVGRARRDARGARQTGGERQRGAPMAPATAMNGFGNRERAEHGQQREDGVVAGAAPARRAGRHRPRRAAPVHRTHHGRRVFAGAVLGLDGREHRVGGRQHDGAGGHRQAQLTRRRRAAHSARRAHEGACPGPSPRHHTALVGQVGRVGLVGQVGYSAGVGCDAATSPDGAGPSCCLVSAGRLMDGTQARHQIRHGERLLQNRAGDVEMCSVGQGLVVAGGHEHDREVR